MVRIRVEYDKYTRSFKLVDQEFGSVLEDGAQYELVLAVENEVEDAVICIRASHLAHA